MATSKVTLTTHGQTNGNAIKHSQTHKFGPYNQQKPTAKAQPTKTHRSTTTNKNPLDHNQQKPISRIHGPQLEHRPTISQAQTRVQSNPDK